MIVIIAGSRHITDPEVVAAAVAASGFDVSEVVCGLADGPDTLGKSWAIAHGIPVKEFEANWRPNGRFDRTAGFQRNTQMGLYAKPNGGLIAVWDEISPGTAHMIEFAKRCKLQVYVHLVTPAAPTSYSAPSKGASQ